MKKIVALIMITMLLFLAACNGNSAPRERQNTAQPTQRQAATLSPAPVEADDSDEPENIATLCVDFSGGNPDLDIRQYELGYSGELTPDMLVKGLTALTGLDFAADAVVAQMGFSVDWKNDSSLFGGLEDVPQGGEFEFYDVDSTRWFMMDSLYRTLLENFDEDAVYYTMDGGMELAFDDLYPVNVFPMGIPYEGSPFYFNHADGRGHLYDAFEAADYLIETLTAAGYNMTGTAVIEDEDGGDAWFGDMAVWYFSWGGGEPGQYTAEGYFAVTYDWEVWQYDTASDEWLMWG